MDPKQNGGQSKLVKPDIPDKPGSNVMKVFFDPEAQVADLAFLPQDFRTWDMVIAVLDMAKHKAEATRRILEVQQIAQQQAEVMQAEALRRKIQMGR